MYPTINLRETGVNLHRIMDKRGITPKDIKEFLNLGSIQTVYNWCKRLHLVFKRSETKYFPKDLDYLINKRVNILKYLEYKLFQVTSNSPNAAYEMFYGEND